jgi:hypothetical protein
MEETRKREAYLWATIVILVLALLYVITLDLWGLSLWGNAVDYIRFGTWSGAIASIGTTAAVIVAFTAWYWQRASQQSAEAKRLVEMETAVFQWLTSKEVRDDDDNLVRRLWDLRIQNSTIAPIYHWKISFFSESGHLCNYLKRPLLPGENVFNLPVLDNVEPSQAPEPTLSFEGSSGRIWIRTSRGLLEQTTVEKTGCVHGTPSPISNRD